MSSSESSDDFEDDLDIQDDRDLYREGLGEGIFSEFGIERLNKIDKKYFDNFNMNLRVYQELFRIVEPKIKKQFDNEHVPVHTCLQMCLSYLITGNEMSLVADEYGVSQDLSPVIIANTCEAILLSLKDSNFPVLDYDYWKEVCDILEGRYNATHCLGTVDMRQLVFEEHTHSDSNNDPNKDCLALFTITDFRGYFAYMNVTKEKLSSGRINFESTWIFRELQNDVYDVPSPADYGPSSDLPYVFVSDTNFPLNTHMIQPYTKSGELTIQQQVYNKHLEEVIGHSSRAFNTIFLRWKILTKKFSTDVQTTLKVVKAIICLHNFLIKNYHLYGMIACSKDDIPSEGCVKVNLYSENSTEDAEKLRDRFRDVVFNDNIDNIDYFIDGD